MLKADVSETNTAWIVVSSSFRYREVAWVTVDKHLDGSWEDFEAWLKIAEMTPRHYGKHGLEAFMAAHHSNCNMTTAFGAQRSWCMATWDEYNDAIDRSGE